MEVTLAADCLSLTLSNSYVIDDIGTDNNQEKICNYSLDVNYNCCTPTSYKIPAKPQVNTVSIVDCGTDLITDLFFPYYQIQLVFDIPECCVTSGKFYSFTDNLLTTIVGPTATFTSDKIYFAAGDIQAGDLLIGKFELTTSDGYVHTFEYTITNVLLADHCATAAVSITDYVAPEVPASYGLTIDTGADTITLTDVSFGQNTDVDNPRALTPGIYCVTIKGENCDGVPLVDGGEYGQQLYSESVVLFVDCNNSVKCRVAQVAVTCPTADPLWIYQTLIYNNTCQVLSCEDACNLYKKLMSLLNNNCAGPAKPCNCG